MDIAKILLFGLVTLTIITLIKNEKPEIAIQISIAFGIIIFMLMLGQLSEVIRIRYQFQFCL